MLDLNEAFTYRGTSVPESRTVQNRRPFQFDFEVKESGWLRIQTFGNIELQNCRAIALTFGLRDEERTLVAEGSGSIGCGELLAPVEPGPYTLEVFGTIGTVVDSFDFSLSLAPVGVCGNAVLELGEDCDDGPMSEVCGPDCRRQELSIRAGERLVLRDGFEVCGQCIEPDCLQFFRRGKTFVARDPVTRSGDGAAWESTTRISACTRRALSRNPDR